MKSSTHGQVLLITVLVLSIAVTIALSLIGRSVTDVTMSRNFEESARAFSAAEAGVEQALRTNTAETNATFAPGIGYSSTIQIIGETTGIYTLPTTTQGQTETVWLVDHTVTNTIDEAVYYQGNSIDICWAHASPVPAVEVALYYRSGGTYLVNRGAYDPDNTTRSANHFSSVTDVNNTGSGCGGLANAYRQTITIPTGAGIVPMMMRIRPYYNNATFTVSPTGNNVLPKQGVEITSSGFTQGGITRKIIVRRQYPGASSIFDYSIYSQQSIIH